MNKIIKSISLSLVLIFSFGIGTLFAENGNDIKINDYISGSNKNSYLDIFKDSSFFGGSEVGEKGVNNLLVNIAKDIKNMAIAVSIIFLIILVLKLLFSSGTDDDIKKWKTGIMWTTIGIMIMQIAFVIVTVLFDKNIGATTAASFLDIVIRPIIRLLEMSAAFIFLSMAIFAFYKLVTSSGEDNFKKAVQTITNAIIGFILIKISGFLVNSIYGQVDCTKSIFGTQMCTGANLGNPNLSEIAKLIGVIIQYATGFVGVITMLLIIYVGFILISSRGNPDSMKKAKNAIMYIFIGIILIVTSIMIFRFIGGGENAIIGTYK